MAIAEFSEALLIIPKILSINAAKDSIDLIAKLRVFHHASQSSDDQGKKELKFSGLDLLNGKVRNNYIAGVIEPAISKIKALKFATEAAITILRIDDSIVIEPEKNEEEEMQKKIR
jgi:T-complex protein 1 subunit alpha